VIRTLKIITLVLVAGGAVAMVRYSGVWREGITAMVFVCVPMFLLCAATALGRHIGVVIFTLCAALFSIYAGVSSYYDAFWSDHRTDINGIVMIYVPAFQGAIGLLVLIVAFVESTIYKRKNLHYEQGQSR
jgi:hypothetical protein